MPSFNLLTEKRAENRRDANFGQKCTPEWTSVKRYPNFQPDTDFALFGSAIRNLPFDGGCGENPVNTPFLGIKNHHLLTKFLLSIDGSFYV
jgi:hypothetical protein